VGVTEAEAGGGAGTTGSSGAGAVLHETKQKITRIPAQGTILYISFISFLPPIFIAEIKQWYTSAGEKQQGAALSSRLKASQNSRLVLPIRFIYTEKKINDFLRRSGIILTFFALKPAQGRGEVL
jgi:hypothetical protein